MADETSGERIRLQFESACERVLIVAPFIKARALFSLLCAIDGDVPVRCVTRWLPQEVAAGISDLEVFDLLDNRKNSELVLVDRLHAKVYVADDRCLVGSANVTFAGLGETLEANVEVLVESNVSDPGVKAVLDEIALSGRLATRSTMEVTRRLAASLSSTFHTGDVRTWFPISRHPERAYEFYEHPPQTNTAAVRLLLSDIANANLPAGLTEQMFVREIKSRLGTIPIAEGILATEEDVVLARADVHSYLATRESEDFTAEDMWSAFVKWMAYFHSDRVMAQEITEIVLRRAQVLRP